MTTVQAHAFGERVLLPRAELERVVELARRSDDVLLEWQEVDLSTAAMMRLAEQGGAFDFWRAEGEDIYTAEDGEPV